jgi:hypothetical protein
MKLGKFMLALSLIELDGAWEIYVGFDLFFVKIDCE